ncbi:M6 family metalloprotease [Pseudomassariella vexata]|uniref:M6 family metalloprotease n=1 Tax=Pseudomassariella vexata TaxID=1141098 RepID=A0A1Y2DYF0_9PEZI|nr:M6 family metalloprotease [Pseudomassariella vexata]ORY64322.1 M6 family metalloprotease [Pseudomassariella vexata]
MVSLAEIGRRRAMASAIVCGFLARPIQAARHSNSSEDPFEILDPQNWVNPDNMTWEDFKAPPGTGWADPSRSGSIRDFEIALIAVDYSDTPFVVTQEPGSTIYGNPQPESVVVDRADVPTYYHDLLNKPGALNRGHTLHEYWMGDSLGRYGVNLSTYGPYQMPGRSWQYGVDTEDFNPGACPEFGACILDLRTDAFAAWRADVGNITAGSFELVFILSAGQDESSTWQEFGEMKFPAKEDIPDEFGPPDNETLPNWAETRYVDWTSWAAASNIWPNAGGGSSTQAESSGMSTYAHEFSHLLSIGDNYNNPYSQPPRRAYTGPYSMMDRGSFNGPGGPHTRWQIPAVQGGSMGSLHTVRDKSQLALISNSSVLQLSREALAYSGLVVANLTARAVDPGEGLMGIRVVMDSDLSPFCNISTDALCDGGSYDNYHVEVVDRMGADSFTPDSGVMISKTRDDDSIQPFQWVIDANPQDIELIDFYRPNGSVAMITVGDYRQLADALFHAGTRSGSEYEFVDEANRLHFYVLNLHRDASGVLSYTTAVRSLDGNATSSTHGVTLTEGKVTGGNPAGAGVSCEFTLKNTGTYSPDSPESPQHPQDVSAWLTSDVYRLNATVEGSGWRIELPNALATANFGASSTVKVAVAAASDSTSRGVVTLSVISESDESVAATAECEVSK